MVVSQGSESVSREVHINLSILPVHLTGAGTDTASYRYLLCSMFIPLFREDEPQFYIKATHRNSA